MTVHHNEVSGEATVRGQTFDFEGLIDEEGVYTGSAAGWVGDIEVSGSLDKTKVRVSRSGYQCTWTISSKRDTG